MFISQLKRYWTSLIWSSRKQYITRASLLQTEVFSIRRRRRLYPYSRLLYVTFRNLINSLSGMYKNTLSLSKSTSRSINFSFFHSNYIQSAYSITRFFTLRFRLLFSITKQYFRSSKERVRALFYHFSLVFLVVYQTSTSCKRVKNK